MNLTAKPDAAIAFTLGLLSQEPFRTLFALTVFPGFTFVALYSTILMGWVERKLTAKIQLRTGPMYAGKFEGILQNLADFFKLLFKEIIIPDGVDKATFIAIPFALMAVAGALIALVPLSPTTYIANPSVGAILTFAILGFTPLVVLLAGWASNSKYPFLGGLRALHQLVAYEIPLILSLLGAVILSGSLGLMQIVEAQSGLWYIFLQPLGPSSSSSVPSPSSKESRSTFRRPTANWSPGGRQSTPACCSGLSSSPTSPGCTFSPAFSPHSSWAAGSACPAFHQRSGSY